MTYLFVILGSPKVLEKVVVIEIERVKHQIPILAPYKVAVFNLVFKETDWVMIAVVLWMWALDKIRLKINHIAFPIGKCDLKFVITARLNFYNVVWIHGIKSFC